MVISIILLINENSCLMKIITINPKGKLLPEEQKYGIFKITYYKI